VLGRQPPTSVFAVASHLLLETVSWVGTSAPPSWLPGLDLGLDPNLPHGAVAARGRVLQHPDLLILDPPTDVAVLFLGRLRGSAAAPRPLPDATADTEATAAAGVEDAEEATARIARALWPKAPRSVYLVSRRRIIWLKSLTDCRKTDRCRETLQEHQREPLA
jgi:hypothetical protein